MGKALGIGGVFFKCQDRDKLASWYQKTLSIDLQAEYGCASFYHAESQKGAHSVLGFFKSDTEYFQPSQQAFMINFIVDDLQACLVQVAEQGGTIEGDICEEPNGKFGWFTDPEGNKVELWQILNEGRYE